MIRIGFGQDSHPFSIEKKKCVLGGIETNCSTKGLKGLSDGDVVVHAICAAIEQALGRKGFSTYADKMCKDGIFDSKEYLKVAVSHMKEAGYKINNIGISVEAKTPKILPIEDKMKEILAPLLETSIDRIGINATTGENLTPFGKGEGVQVFVLVSIIKKDFNFEI